MLRNDPFLLIPLYNFLFLIDLFLFFFFFFVSMGHYVICLRALEFKRVYVHVYEFQFAF
jgi:hypothetical protein